MEGRRGEVGSERKKGVETREEGEERDERRDKGE